MLPHRRLQEKPSGVRLNPRGSALAKPPAITGKRPCNAPQAKTDELQGLWDTCQSPPPGYCSGHQSVVAAGTIAVHGDGIALFRAGIYWKVVRGHPHIASHILWGRFRGGSHCSGILARVPVRTPATSRGAKLQTSAPGHGRGDCGCTHSGPRARALGAHVAVTGGRQGLGTPFVDALMAAYSIGTCWPASVQFVFNVWTSFGAKTIYHL